MCGGIEDVARDARRCSWKYLECPRTWAASFVATRIHGGRDYQSSARPDGETVEGSTYLFGCAVLQEVERARGGDDSGIAERSGVDQGPRVVEQIIPDQSARQ